MRELFNITLDKESKKAIRTLKTSGFNVSALVRIFLIEKAKGMK
jgi:hypothetical protein